MAIALAIAVAVAVAVAVGSVAYGELTSKPPISALRQQTSKLAS